MNKSIFLCAVLLIISTASFAQIIQVSGTVCAADNHETIPGAGVIQIASTNGTVTDLDGNYSIYCPSDCILNFSALGFISQDIAVEGRTIINVELKPDPDWMNAITPWLYIKPRPLSPLYSQR